MDWACPDCGYKPKIINNITSFAPSLAEKNNCFDVEFFRELANLEKGNFWFEARNNLIIWAIQNYFPYAKNFLEIGCGTGVVLSNIKETFPSVLCYGSEIYTEGLEYAKKRIKDDVFFQMDARDIPFEDEFDLIGAFDVLEHIVEDETVLSNICKALKNNGGIILTVPQHPFLWSSFDEGSKHVRRYTRKDITEKLEKCGFKIVRTTSFVAFLLPFMFLSRLVKKTADNKKCDIVNDLAINSFLNSIFYKIMSVERLLISSGINFPLGGSLLLVAHKQNLKK